MFNMETPLFWYKFIFMAELLISFALTTYTLKKKRKFIRKCFLGIVISVFVSFIFPIKFYNAIYISLMFLVLFITILIAAKFCYEESMINILFCGIIAYTAQHIAYSIYNFIVTVTGFSTYGAVYAAEGGVGNYNVFTLLIYLTVYSLVYWAVWAFVAYRIRYQENLCIGRNLAMLFFSTSIVLTDIVINTLVTYGMTEPMPSVVYFAFFIQSLLCCLLALGIQFTMLGRQIAVSEAERINELWKIDRKNYEIFQQNVELINIKCHDLKHQIRDLRKVDGEISKDALKEIEQAINIYSCKIETGNNVLDAVLAEKGLQCEYEQIRFRCIADGSALAFFRASEVYTLFGNAMTNAIEAVKQTNEIEKRLISLNVERKGGMLFIHLENYCPNAKKLVFVNGLPKTTKADKDYHGFGLRSMQLLAEKYNGGMDVHVENDMFMLNILIPQST